MNLQDLRDFLKEIPEEINDFELVNGEMGQLGEEEGGFMYRVDKPIIALYVDEATKEICFLHQTQEDITHEPTNEDGPTTEH